MFPSPCKDCCDRHFNCHSQCEKYLAFKDKVAELNRLIREKKAEDSAFYRLEKQRKW